MRCGYAPRHAGGRRRVRKLPPKRGYQAEHLTHFRPFRADSFGANRIGSFQNAPSHQQPCCFMERSVLLTLFSRKHNAKRTAARPRTMLLTHGGKRTEGDEERAILHFRLYRPAFSGERGKFSKHSRRKAITQPCRAGCMSEMKWRNAQRHGNGTTPKRKRRGQARMLLTKRRMFARFPPLLQKRLGGHEAVLPRRDARVRLNGSAYSPAS